MAAARRSDRIATNFRDDVRTEKDAEVILRDSHVGAFVVWHVALEHYMLSYRTENPTAGEYKIRHTKLVRAGSSFRFAMGIGGERFPTLEDLIRSRSYLKPAPADRHARQPKLPPAPPKRPEGLSHREDNLSLYAQTLPGAQKVMSIKPQVRALSAFGIFFFLAFVYLVLLLQWEGAHSTFEDLRVVAEMDVKQAYTTFESNIGRPEVSCEGKVAALGAELTQVKAKLETMLLDIPVHILPVLAGFMIVSVVAWWIPIVFFWIGTPEAKKVKWVRPVGLVAIIGASALSFLAAATVPYVLYHGCHATTVFERATESYKGGHVVGRGDTQMTLRDLANRDISVQCQLAWDGLLKQYNYSPHILLAPVPSWLVTATKEGASTNYETLCNPDEHSWIGKGHVPFVNDWADEHFVGGCMVLPSERGSLRLGIAMTAVAMTATIFALVAKDAAVDIANWYANRKEKTD